MRAFFSKHSPMGTDLLQAGDSSAYASLRTALSVLVLLPVLLRAGKGTESEQLPADLTELSLEGASYLIG